MTERDRSVLEATDLHVYYGDSSVLRGANLTAKQGRITALLGRNGMGKTTLVNAIMGMVPIRRGTIRLHDQDVTDLASWRRGRQGLALVPQGRRVFTSLTVEENIKVAGRGADALPLERIYDLFPNLRDRVASYGGKLSGGEQQMLAIARALRTAPTVMLMDEPSEGLAPQIVARVGDLLTELRDDGMTIVLVEQNLPLALEVADDVHVMGRGHIVFSGTVQQFRDRPEVQREHLGV